MSLPRATVRLQLHAGFTLWDACEQVAYYARLGISHYYVSPVSCARPGSMHGYDVIDYANVSPALGGVSALTALAGRLHKCGMGLVLDIVPNHMAAHADNAWWWDVLRHGQASTYASWLDIDWQAQDAALTGKVLAPFLPTPYGQALNSGEIRLVFDEVAGAFLINACGAPYPLAPGSLLTQDMSPSQLLALHDGSQPQGRQRLHALLERQHYRLSWWRCAADSINWRRFFEINELIGVRVERQEVFDAVHALPLRLFSEGLVDGLRIDHIDGLADPTTYCQRLSQALKQRAADRPGALGGDEPWLIVEKILAYGETLDERWPVHGTSGYDFMDQVGAVHHDPEAEPLLTEHWHALAHDARASSEWVYEARQLILRRHLAAERQGLLLALSRLAQASFCTRDWTCGAIARVLDEMLQVFPVYRSYGQAGARSAVDAAHYAQIVQQARDRLGAADGSSMLLLEQLDAWLGASAAVSTEEAVNGRMLQNEAIRRFQQLTPPLAAKSLEDTVFYRYGRMLSRNEVGSDPAVMAMTPEDFHDCNFRRAAQAPFSMLATATHDHKRGEDVRARLAVLSEIPQLWVQDSLRWLHWPDAGRPIANARQAGERYMLFQTLVGAWPLGLAVDDSAGVRSYIERVAQWQTKALREAKINSGWFEPDIEYEQASAGFLYGLLPGEPGHSLLCDIERFARAIAPAGAVNSLAQVLLRVASPGVPDLYQGTEFWDFSLVDPDNRRDVDYTARQAGLCALEDGPDILALLNDWHSGRLKQAVLARSLALRRDMPEAFTQGDYFCLPVLGPKSRHVLAFLRTWHDNHVLVLTPRLCAQGVGVQGGQGLPQTNLAFWNDTGVVLPRRYIGASLHDVLTGRGRQCGPDGVLRLADAFADLPLALLRLD